MDEQRLLVTGLMLDTFGYVYQVEEDNWAPSRVVVPNPNRAEVQGVRDLETGLVYFAGGFETDDSIMSVYNFTRDTVVSPNFIIPTGMMADRSYYAGVYVKSRKSIFYFGGFPNSNGGQINSGPGALTEFVPSTGAWSKLVSSGPKNMVVRGGVSANISWTFITLTRNTIDDHERWTIPSFKPVHGSM
jgi:hypothetical protein